VLIYSSMLFSTLFSQCLLLHIERVWHNMSRFFLEIVVLRCNVCGKVWDSEFLELTIGSINTLLNDFALRIKLAEFATWFILMEESGLAKLFVLFRVDNTAVSAFLSFFKLTLSHFGQLELICLEFDQSLSWVDHIVLCKVLIDRLVVILNDSGVSCKHWLNFVKEHDLMRVIEVLVFDGGSYSLFEFVILG